LGGIIIGTCKLEHLIASFTIMHCCGFGPNVLCVVTQSVNYRGQIFGLGCASAKPMPAEA
jgi:hypothetical protein